MGRKQADKLRFIRLYRGLDVYYRLPFASSDV